jgi:murein DD-endopeptidase MepM/ murein hydrolase activator NlpD
MRRLAPTARSVLIHSGQTAALIVTGLLAMAASPVAEPQPEEVAPVAAPVQAVAAPAGPVKREIGFAMPVKNHPINSPFGARELAGEGKVRLHKGVDIAAPTGTGVFAASEGVVLRTGYDAGGYGNFIELRHPNGMTSLYGHLSRVDVASGMAVALGARIGLVGSTGYSTGPHLHFEIKRAGVQVNPTRVMGRRFTVAAKPI